MGLFLIAAGILGYIYFQGKKQTVSAAAPARARQTVSTIARQGFRQGKPGVTPGYANKGEGARAIYGTQSGAIVDQEVAKLQARIATTFDPQWKMRWTNALYRMQKQQSINNGEQPQGPVVMPRVTNYVNADNGVASAWTRTQFTYQDRFKRGTGVPSGASPVNPTRVLDQNDNGDQTAMATTLQQNGFKSVIYPRNWQAPVRNLTQEDQTAQGSKTPYNFAATPQTGPTNGIPQFKQVKRCYTGALQKGY
jgi:hypothetical protein